jgi:hypothetical protein
MLGVTRIALVEMSKSSHKRYKVLDPLDDSVEGTEGRGDRITLYQGEQVLVDLIVGNKLEGEQDVYYVRQPDRDQVYTADLGKLEISTKFVDWIKADVLELDRNDLQQVIVDTYHIDESRGVLVREEQFGLNMGEDQKWTLDDLDPTKEKLKEFEVTSTISALDELKIVGIRPKPDNLRAALKGEEGGRLDLQGKLDMQDKGFFFDPESGRILANEGNIVLSSRKGVVYIVKFGEEFTGTDVDLEVGQTAGGEAKPAEAAKTEEAPAADADGEPKDEKPAGRYIFVSAQFDPELLGPKPEPPVKPEPPAEGTTPAADAAAPAEKTEGDAAAPAPEDPKAAYEKALKEYELAESVYNDKLKFYEEDLKAAEKAVKELNGRFADWYYVIGDDVYKKLRLKRASIVEAAQPETPPAGTAPDPSLPMPATETPAAPVEAAATPAPDRPAAPAAPEKVEEPAAETPPADGATPPAEPAAETNPASPAEGDASTPVDGQ